MTNIKEMLGLLFPVREKFTLRNTADNQTGMKFSVFT